MAPADKRKWIPVKEYAQYRGVTVRTVQRWLKDKKIPGDQPAGKKGMWFVPWEAKR